MSQICALLILVSKGQVHVVLMIENSFRTMADCTSPIMKIYSFIQLHPMGQRCTLLILGSKGQGQGY